MYRCENYATVADKNLELNKKRLNTFLMEASSSSSPENLTLSVMMYQTGEINAKTSWSWRKMVLELSTI